MKSRGQPEDLSITFYLLGLGGILCLALGLRLLGLNKGIWLDEFTSWSYIVSGGLGFLWEKLSLDTSPPLYFMLLKVWSGLGDSEPVLRLFSVIWGMGVVALVMHWLKDFSRQASLLGGLLCATLPPLLRYSQEIRGYSLLIFAFTLAFWSASRINAAPERVWPYLCLALSLVVATATHMVGAMFVLPVGSFMFLTWETGRRVRWSRLFLVGALQVATFLFFYLAYLTPRDIRIWWMPPIAKGLAFSVIRNIKDGLNQAWPWHRLPESLFFVRKVLNIAGFMGILGFMAILLGSGKWRRTGPFLVAALTYWFQLILYTFLVLPIIWDRTLLPGLIPFIGFLSLQIATFKLPKVKIFYVLALVALCLFCAWSWATGKAYQPVEQWRPIAKILQKEWRPGNPVICYPDYIRGPLGYYFLALPQEAVVKMYPGREPTGAQATLKTLASQGPGWGEPPQVFLIINLYTHILNDRGNYQKMLDIVAAEAPRPATLIVVVTFDQLITMHPGLLRTRADILEDLATSFGPPATFHKQGTIYHLKYQITPGGQDLKRPKASR